MDYTLLSDEALRAAVDGAFDALGVAGVDAPMTLVECALSVVEERDALRAEVERLRERLRDVEDDEAGVCKEVSE